MENVPSICTLSTDRSSSTCRRFVVRRKASVTSFVLVCSASSPLPNPRYQLYLPHSFRWKRLTRHPSG